MLRAGAGCIKLQHRANRSSKQHSQLSWLTPRTTMIAFLPLLIALTAQGPDSVDVLIRRGTVYDGSLTPSRVTDVGIRADRIVFVGDAAQARVRAGRVIEAQGLIVAP